MLLFFRGLIGAQLNPILSLSVFKSVPQNLCFPAISCVFEFNVDFSLWLFVDYDLWFLVLPFLYFNFIIFLNIYCGEEDFQGIAAASCLQV